MRTADTQFVSSEHGLSESGAVKRELILAVSSELFADRGYSASTMRQLAERAGLPLGNVYYYFSSKYDLLVAIIDNSMSGLQENAQAIVGGGGRPTERLAALAVHHVDVHLANPHAARVADRELRSLSPDDRERIVARRDKYEQCFRQVLSEGIELGEFSSGTAIPFASAAIITMCSGIIDWWSPNGAVDRQQSAEILSRYAVQIVGGRLASAHGEDSVF